MIAFPKTWRGLMFLALTLFSLATWAELLLATSGSDGVCGVTLRNETSAVVTFTPVGSTGRPAEIEVLNSLRLIWPALPRFQQGQVSLDPGEDYVLAWDWTVERLHALLITEAGGPLKVLYVQPELSKDFHYPVPFDHLTIRNVGELDQAPESLSVFDTPNKRIREWAGALLPFLLIFAGVWPRKRQPKS